MNNKKKFVFNIVLKVLSYISLFFLLFIACFLTFYIISNQIAKVNNKVPLISIYTIVSPSMEPNIMVYDVIVDKRVNSDKELKEGDIITFYNSNIDTDGYTITHRIYKKITDEEGNITYITKGDNNQTEDRGEITLNDIVGKKVIVFPKLGKLQLFLSSKTGWLLVILIPSIGIIISDIFKLIKIYKIRKQVEGIPDANNIDSVREVNENKNLESLIKKAQDFNNKK